MQSVEGSLLGHREECEGTSKEKVACKALVLIPVFWWPELGTWPRR